MRIACATAICLSSVALGQTYNELKMCLQDCINTTPPWTIARALCVADCTLNPPRRPGVLSQSSGYTPYGGTNVLDWTAGGMVTVAISMPDMPGAPVIDRIDFRLYNSTFSTLDPFGVFLASTPGNGMTSGVFSATFNSDLYKAMDGCVIIEVHNVGTEVIADSSAIYMIPAPAAALFPLVAPVIFVRGRRSHSAR